MPNTSKRLTPFNTEDCMKNTDLNQYEVALIAAARIKEYNKGASPYIKNTDGHHPYTIALMEISRGLIGREYLKR